MVFITIFWSIYKMTWPMQMKLNREHFFHGPMRYIYKSSMHLSILDISISSVLSCVVFFPYTVINTSWERSSLFLAYVPTGAVPRFVQRGGLYTILVTFNANDVEVEWRPRASGARGPELCSFPPPPPHAKKKFRFFHLKRHLQNSWKALCRYDIKSGVYLISQQ